MSPLQCPWFGSFFFKSKNMSKRWIVNCQILKNLKGQRSWDGVLWYIPKTYICLRYLVAVFSLFSPLSFPFSFFHSQCNTILTSKRLTIHRVVIIESLLVDIRFESCKNHRCATTYRMVFPQTDNEWFTKKNLKYLRILYSVYYF